VPTLSWEQVRAWRARASFLEHPGELVEVARALVGIHAQVMSAAELAIGARVDGITPEDVRAAVWERRLLVKTWAQRGTLHLLPADEMPLWAAALSTRWRIEPSWLKYHGVTEAEVDAINAAIPRVLDGQCLTRAELAEALSRHAGPRLGQLLLSGWGTLLKPSSYLGNLCFGPSDGQNVRFVRPDQWIGGAWPRLDPQESLKELGRRWLHAYGPSTHEEWGRWWGVRPSDGRRLLKSLADELVEVEVEGQHRWLLAADLPSLSDAPPYRGVRLLGMFDPYVVGSWPRDSILDPAYKARVHREAGWVSAVVLVNGRIAGTWEAVKRGKGLEIAVTPFEPFAKSTQAAIAAETDRISRFLGQAVELSLP
jgi:uncharacterized protein YcaQ